MTIKSNNDVNTNQYYLGIDFGIKKIGFAIGQLITKKASPLTIILNKSKKINLEEIDKIIQDWDVKVIILGYPYYNEASPFTKKLDNFFNQLHEKYKSKIKIIKFSEELSTEISKEAYRDLRRNNISKKKEELDDISASIILQSWFNENMIN